MIAPPPARTPTKKQISESRQRGPRLRAYESPGEWVRWIVQREVEGRFSMWKSSPRFLKLRCWSKTEGNTTIRSDLTARWVNDLLHLRLLCWTTVQQL